MKSIKSRDNPFYKSLYKLATSSRERRRLRTTILDGVHVIEAYAASGHQAQTLVLKESAVDKPEIRTLTARCAARETVVLGDALFDATAQVASPVGVMALVHTPEPAALPEKIGDAILLEEIQDPGNLGSILRSAAAAGVRQVFLSKKSLFAWSPKVLRAAMGAHFQIEIHEDVDLIALAGRCSGRIVATTPDAGKSLYQLDLKGQVAWVFGNEGAGISAALLGAVNQQARIPMPGNTESLNIAAAAAVCLFEQLRQRSKS